MMNWYFGWSMLVAAFVSGAGLGLFFYRDDFLGGYNTFQRRIVRLGHIALAALGIINVLFSLVPTPTEPTVRTMIASIGFAVGGVTMPAVCFLTAWRLGFRHLFFIPVISLIVAALQMLWIGPP
jgi:hypothetical protein